jgi:TPR repeat protein
MLQGKDSIGEVELLAATGKGQDAAAMLERLIKAGDVFAELRLGYCYWMADGVERDLTKAEQLFRSAASTGLQLGAYYLAQLLFESNRQEEGLKEIKALVAQGYLPAVTRLAWCLEDGKGCTVDKVAARHYRNWAADHGHLWAEKWRAADMILAKEGYSRILRGLLRWVRASALIFWRSLGDHSDPTVQP